MGLGFRKGGRLRFVVSHSAKPLTLNLKQMSEGSGRVPHVRPSVRGPKTMGDPDFLPRGATNVRVCGFH
jgi:hypothetical protein